MVLQRDSKIKIWGWASRGEKVSMKFNGKSYKTKTGEDGKWTIQLPPMKAGGPFTMEIIASNKITVSDVLIGDVWICAGQSNMVIPMERVKEKYPDEIANANYPQIKHFFIATATDLQRPQDDLPAGNTSNSGWKSANPKDVLLFSAAAYFFAKEIYQKYHVPIGLINASVGGTPIEAWISETGFQEFPAQLNTIQKNKDTAYVNGINRRSVTNSAGGSARKETDKGLTGEKTWFDPAYIPKGWHNINIPGYWEDQGIKDLNGVVWYRKEIDVPVSMTEIPAKLFMGRIVDADFVYVNGKLAGNITYQYPPRRYELPVGLLNPGKNSIVIRVINYSGKGGFVPDKPYYLKAGDQTIDLKGDWQFKVGDVFPPPAGQGNAGISFQNQPSALFNAMIAPLTNYSMKGMLWYQGEANAGRPEEYEKLLPTLIADWRNQWKQYDAPFLFVQLPNFMDRNYSPSESQWAVLRESQLKALAVPNTAMAVTIDIGEWNDIHPLNKKDVGYRLALAAKKVAYGEKDIVYSGPVVRSASIDGNKIIISFNHVGSGLVTNDGEELSQFAIAGADKKFVWAQAKIETDKVVVSSENIANPVYVRYAWADNPEGANLYNKEGLPASPFRTDGPAGKQLTQIKTN
jgi:sialate O-acetylesterase